MQESVGHGAQASAPSHPADTACGGHRPVFLPLLTCLQCCRGAIDPLKQLLKLLPRWTGLPRARCLDACCRDAPGEVSDE